MTTAKLNQLGWHVIQVWECCTRSGSFVLARTLHLISMTLTARTADSEPAVSDITILLTEDEAEDPLPDEDHALQSDHTKYGQPD